MNNCPARKGRVCVCVKPLEVKPLEAAWVVGIIAAFPLSPTKQAKGKRKRGDDNHPTGSSFSFSFQIVLSPKREREGVKGGARWVGLDWRRLLER